MLDRTGFLFLPHDLRLLVPDPLLFGAAEGVFLFLHRGSGISFVVLRWMLRRDWGGG
jgi:hypothetical protein